MILFRSQKSKDGAFFFSTMKNPVPDKKVEGCMKNTVRPRPPESSLPWPSAQGPIKRIICPGEGCCQARCQWHNHIATIIATNMDIIWAFCLKQGFWKV